MTLAFAFEKLLNLSSNLVFLNCSYDSDLYLSPLTYKVDLAHCTQTAVIV